MFCGLWSVLCFQQLMRLTSLACICILIVKIISESLFHILPCHLTFEKLDNMIVAQLVKNPATMRETWVQSLGWEELLQYSGLENSSPIGSQSIGHN